MTATTTTTVRGTTAPKKKPTPRPATQDHKPKAEKPSVKKVEGGREITFMGVTAVVTDEALDDFELLDDLRTLEEDENPAVLPAVLRRLVGRDSYKDVLDGLRDPKGKVSLTKAMGYVSGVLGSLSPNS